MYVFVSIGQNLDITYISDMDMKYNKMPSLYPYSEKEQKNSFQLSNILTTYVTIQNGLWNSPSTWSGGNVPNEFLGGDVVTIHHMVTWNRGNDLYVQNGILNVNGGVLTIPDHNIKMENSSGKINITNGLIKIIDNNFEVISGTVNFSSGAVQLCNGNYKNENSSSTNGTGYIYSQNGNIESTNNSFSSNIAWCVGNGGGVGLPTGQNCGLAKPPGGCQDMTYYLSLVNENCSNGIDDDGDGLVDCNDSDCGQPVVSNISLTHPTCSNPNGGAITITATGSNLQYSKNNGVSYQSNNVFTGLNTGTYPLIIRNSVTGCHITASRTLNTSIINDNDNDGICDGDDIDDDNDGLRDIDECAAIYRINVGGSAYTDARGRTWTADNYFTGGTNGNHISATANINNGNLPGSTTDDFVYQSLRVGTGNNGTETFWYKFPISNGSYRVVFHWRDCFSNANGRSMNIYLEHVQVAAGFNAFHQIGNCIAGTRTYSTTVNDGELLIDFGGAGFPVLYAIEIFPADCDTDNDNTPDYFDLDSDNDGCADAIEAGHNETVQANSTILPPYGNNGLAASVEANDLFSTSINYTIAQQSGANNFQNDNIGGGCIVTCALDNDGDLICDEDDIDDDNDGILDVDEGCCNLDTDNDGIPDYFDLDSDNDGCADAIEAGHLEMLQIDSTIAGPYGNNGLAASVENNDLQTASVNYTVTQTTATINDFQNNNVSNNCIEVCNDNIDNDGDGLIDCADSDCLQPVIIQVISSNPTCGNNNGSIQIDFVANANQPTIEFSLDGGNTWSLSTSASSSIITANQLGAGSYDLLARYPNIGCINIIGTEILVNDNNPVVCSPTVILEKTATDTVHVGGNITYYFTIRNNSGVVLNNINFIDNLNLGLIYYSNAMQMTNGIQAVGTSLNSTSTNLILNNIPIGTSSFLLIANVPITYKGPSIYLNQAELTNLTASNPSLPNSVLSDYPISTTPNDPTPTVIGRSEICTNGIDDDLDGLDDCNDPDCQN